MVKYTEPVLIEWLRRRARLPTDARLIAGIGDDCAIFRPRRSPDDLLFTTDMFLEGVHFPAHAAAPAASPADLGWKTLARGLSDIAAMGGAPTFCLLSL